MKQHVSLFKLLAIKLIGFVQTPATDHQSARFVTACFFALTRSDGTLKSVPREKNIVRYPQRSAGGNHRLVIPAALRKLVATAANLASAAHRVRLNAPTRT
ncbi:hypothetical protein ACEPPN_014497 [Leptodophora sp. 'Broadleaf-Isolate-01']